MGNNYEKEDKELGNFKPEWECEGGIHNTSQPKHSLSNLIYSHDFTHGHRTVCPAWIFPWASDLYLQLSSRHHHGETPRHPNSNYSTSLPSLLLLLYSLYHHLPINRLEN